MLENQANIRILLLKRCKVTKKFDMLLFVLTTFKYFFQ